MPGMDDLQKVFHTEALQSLDACAVDLDALRMGDETEAVDSMLDRVRSIREMAAFLGMSEIEVAAAPGLAALEAIRDDGPDADESIAHIAPSFAHLPTLL